MHPGEEDIVSLKYKKTNRQKKAGNKPISCFDKRQRAKRVDCSMEAFAEWEPSNKLGIGPLAMICGENSLLKSPDTWGNSIISLGIQSIGGSSTCHLQVALARELLASEITNVKNKADNQMLFVKYKPRQSSSERNVR